MKKLLLILSVLLIAGPAFATGIANTGGFPHTFVGDCTAVTNPSLNDICFDTTAGAGTGIWLYKAAGWTRQDDTTGGSGGTTNIVGNCTGASCFVDGVSDGTTLWYEGSTIDGFETILTFSGDPGADFIVSIPNETGTLLTSNTSLVGDVTGIAGATVVGNDSHDHSAAGSTVTIDTADIADVSVTQVELEQLETIGATTVSANQWGAVGSMAETLTGTELSLLDGITAVSGADGVLITGTSTNGECAQFNVDGDIVGAGAACGSGGGLDNVVEDTTPQIGGTAGLDMQGQDITSGGVVFMTEQADAEADVAGQGQLWVNTATPNELWFTDDAGTDVQLGQSGGLANVVEDTTPQLGGNLDVNTNSIVSTSNGDITLAPNGTGDVVVTGTTWAATTAGAITAQSIEDIDGPGTNWEITAAGAATFASMATANAVTPNSTWTDSDTTDEDVSSIIQTNCTTTTSAAEDCDIFIGSQTAGSAAASTERVFVDGDGPVHIENGYLYVGDSTTPSTPATATAEGDLFVEDALEVDGATDLDGTLLVAGTAVFSSAPMRLPSAADPTTNTDGDCAFDQDAWAAGRDAMECFDGVASTYVVATQVSDSPTNGQVPKWNTGGTITWEDDTGAGTVNTADIADVSVTQTELAELETIGATTISANQWAAVGGMAETLTSTELNLLDGITTLSGSNTGDNDQVGAVTSTSVCQGDGALVQCDIASLANLNTALSSTVADGAHTTDTGPSPDCAGTTTYQDGEGGCDDISSVYEGTLTNSAGLAGALSDEEGSGGGFVRATSPTLTTPVLGAASATSISVTSQTECVKLNASAANALAAGNATVGSVDGTSFAYWAAQLDNTADETVNWEFDLPANFLASGAVTAEYKWTNVTGTTGTVCLGVQSLGFANDEAFRGSWTPGAFSGATDTSTASGDIMVSASFTLTETWAAEDHIIFAATRDVDAGGTGCTADAMAEDMHLLSIDVCYEVDNVFSGE